VRFVSRGVFPGAASCPRCGGAHTARERCPLDATALPSPLPSVVAGSRRRSILRTIAAWAGGSISTAVLVVCLTVAGVYISELTQASTDAVSALAVVLVSIGVGAVLGMGLMYAAARVYAKVVFALLSVLFLTAGFLMVVFAPVARQMNTPELAEYTAFNTLLFFGALTLVAGLVLGASCVRWALRPHALRRIGSWSRMLAAIYGVVQGMSGVLMIFALFALVDRSARAGEQSIAAQAISVAVIAALSLVPGVVLTFHSISAMMGEGSGEFRPPIALRWLAGWSLVLLAGGLAMAHDPPAAWPMPVLHVLAAALPGVVMVALVARGTPLRGQPVRGLTWRQVTLAAGISMSLGVALAVYVETVGDLGAVVLTLVHHGAFEDEVWQPIQHSKDILTRNEQFAANFIAAAIMAPLVEEFAKGLGVRFMLRRYNTRGQAMVLGAAAGAAFGFVEAMLYGLAGVQDEAGRWWLFMLLRAGSTSLHVFNTSLVALAWWYWSFGKRPRLGWLLFAGAVLMHAMWNGLLVTLTSRIFGLETLSQHVVEVVAYVMVSGVAVALVGALPVIARRLRDPLPPPVDGTPLAGMSPWL